eukprot:2695674-Amphidinium_carterae.1
MSRLSIWQNSLEGVLPEMRIMENDSTILMHGNHFSCKLPLLPGVKPEFCLALIGNRFTLPNKDFPAWVQSDEAGDYFCVSNRDGRILVSVYVSVASLLLLSLLRAKPPKTSAERQLRNVAHTNAKMAWQRTCQLLTVLSLGSVLLLALYTVAMPFLCMVVLQRFRFPVLVMGCEAQCSCAAVVSAWTVLVAARFHREHHHKSRMNLGKGRRQTSLIMLQAAMVWNLWLVLCMLSCVPVALYAAVKAVP